ncbi:hypothetical protein PV08_10989 [Exophiala spinifera]|uniref:Uncharacterized protein n=1 Tax=Exophiala spinifera TaxID=91928 RepID=A0A0D1ZFA3_9EURO|nr:uncharacterized protein PV08_10989 [Exophiala spinifera]KIW11687.1 hypothetical protein PV08_10989 [Exophiala spinifera]
MLGIQKGKRSHSTSDHATEHWDCIGKRHQTAHKFFRHMKIVRPACEFVSKIGESRSTAIPHQKAHGLFRTRSGLDLTGVNDEEVGMPGPDYTFETSWASTFSTFPSTAAGFRQVRLASTADVDPSLWSIFRFYGATTRSMAVENTQSGHHLVHFP